MPTYTITDPTSGKQVKLTGDSPPTEAELNDVFAKLNGTGLSIPKGSTPQAAIAAMKDYNAKSNPEPTEPSALDSLLSFGKGALSQVNPVEIVKGLYGAARHPWDTATGLASAQIEQLKKGKAAYDKGNYSEAFGHALAGVTPLVGPQAANIGENIGAGNVAEGLGQGAGLVGAIVGPQAVASGVKALQGTRAANAVADAAQAGAESRVVDVMAPKVGANKARFGNMAQGIAGQVAAEPDLSAMSREGLHAKVAAKLDEATALLDDASDARNANHAHPTAPIIKALESAKSKLTAQAVEGSLPAPTMTGTSPSGLVKMPESVPIGEDVVPSPNAGRVAQIDKAIGEIKTLGPIARYDSLKTIRQAYDQVAKVKYAPSITADFLAKQGEASGAADVTSALRDHLAQLDPQTAKANGQYAIWRKADDVLKATAEVERTRPKVGRQIAARLTGAVAGGEAGGGLGAVMGYALAPIVDSLVSSGTTSKVVTARFLSDIAKALRDGDASGVATRLKTLRHITVPAKAVGQLPEQQAQP